MGEDHRRHLLGEDHRQVLGDAGPGAALAVVAHRDEHEHRVGPGRRGLAADAGVDRGRIAALQDGAVGRVDPGRVELGVGRLDEAAELRRIGRQADQEGGYLVLLCSLTGHDRSSRK